MFSLKLGFENAESDGRLDNVPIEEYECLEEVIMDVCDHLSNESNVEFRVEGFGIEWPVDVQTDLATIVPQIEDVVISLRESVVASIQFYEQGIEKELEFLRVDDKIFIKCKDLMSSEALGMAEESSFLLVDRMLVQFLVSFVQCAQQRFPVLCDNPFFKELSLNTSSLTAGF